MPENAIKSTLKVLVVEPSGLLGGSELALLDLLNTVRESDISLVAACPDGTSFVKAARKAGTRVIEGPIGMLHRSGRMQRLLAMIWLARIIRRESPDVIHVNQAGFATLAKYATFPRKIPVIAHVRLIEDAEKIRAKSSSHSLPDVCIAISSAVREALDHSQQHVFLVHDPFDAAAFRNTLGPSSRQRIRDEFGIPDEGRIVLHVGRICEQKGQHIFAEAAILLGDPKNFYLMIGAVPPADSEARGYRQRLEEQISSRGREESIRFAGERHDVAALIDASDAVVMSSRGESFGRVLLEALAIGKPVIGPAEAGPQEIIGAEERGFLFEPLNAQSLAHAMNRCFANYDEALARAARGREWISTVCDPRRHADNIASIWRRAARARSGEAS